MTKLQAADLARRSGAIVVIAKGDAPDVIIRVAAGEMLGTRFLPVDTAVESRKRFILSGGGSGRLLIDPGAVKALLGGSSLLPAGLLRVEGDFGRGETVTLCSEDGKEIGRGLVNYGEEDCRELRGCQSNEIETRLGYFYGEEIVHRDNLVLL